MKNISTRDLRLIEYFLKQQRQSCAYAGCNDLDMGDLPLTSKEQKDLCVALGKKSPKDIEVVKYLINTVTSALATRRR